MLSLPSKIVNNAKTSNATSGPCHVTHTGLPFARNRDIKISIKLTEGLGRNGELHITYFLQ